MEVCSSRLAIYAGSIFSIFVILLGLLSVGRIGPFADSNLTGWSSPASNWACLQNVDRGRQELQRVLKERSMDSKPLVVHVAHEAGGVASFGGLGGAVGNLLKGEGEGAVVIVPFFGMFASDPSVKPLMSYDVSCGLAGFQDEEILSSSSSGSVYNLYLRDGPGKSLTILVQFPTSIDEYRNV